MSPTRIRDVLPKLRIGEWPPGPKNSITDIEGVLVHTQSIHLPASEGYGAVNTGVTVILPRKDFFRNSCYAGISALNGRGELTGSHWINETGLLNSPLVLTGTFGIGAGHQGVYEYLVREYPDVKRRAVLPVVGETWDGHLSDVSRFAVKPEHIVAGIQSATSDPVPEGNAGGGTGMVCHGFKGGTGSSSRVISGSDVKDGTERSYTIGVLVQANYGRSRQLTIGGVPVGRLFQEEHKTRHESSDTQQEDTEGQKDSSIIIIVGTDAPLHPLQLKRLATRATVGLSRVGGLGHNSSGDIFLAFSTANHESLKNGGQWGGTKDPAFEPRLLDLQALDENTINELMEGTADATEEAIYNALCGAETMVGLEDRKMEAMPLDKLKALMERYLD